LQSPLLLFALSTSSRKAFEAFGVVTGFLLLNRLCFLVIDISLHPSVFFFLWVGFFFSAFLSVDPS